MWKVVFTKQAAKDAKKLKAAGLDGKAKKLIDVVRKTLLQPPSLRSPCRKSLGILFPKNQYPASIRLFYRAKCRCP